MPPDDDRKGTSQPYQTAKTSYTELLLKKQASWWKRILDVQAPYRWNLQHLKPGFTLEIGCGVGRNLINLKGNGVGVDHNASSIAETKERGFTAFTPEEFERSAFSKPDQFDSLLLAHVAEHMTQRELVNLLDKYLACLKPKGKLIVITPQELGYKSDPTHVEFMDFAKLRRCSDELGLTFSHAYSFPFPRFLGRLFTYNEFVSVAIKPENIPHKDC
jgi:SAM-dependent methyltransferase